MNKAFWPNVLPDTMVSTISVTIRSNITTVFKLGQKFN